MGGGGCGGWSNPPSHSPRHQTTVSLPQPTTRCHAGTRVLHRRQAEALQWGHNCGHTEAPLGHRNHQHTTSDGKSQGHRHYKCSILWAKPTYNAFMSSRTSPTMSVQQMLGMYAYDRHVTLFRIRIVMNSFVTNTGNPSVLKLQGIHSGLILL